MTAAVSEQHVDVQIDDLPDIAIERVFELAGWDCRVRVVPLVCRRWRAITAGASPLWSSLEGVEGKLLRADARLAGFLAWLTPRVGAVRRLATAKGHAVALPGPLLAPLAPRLTELFSLYVHGGNIAPLAACSRLAALGVSASWPQVQQLLGGGGAAPWPALQKLVLSCRNGREPGASLPPALLSMTQLRSLALCFASPHTVVRAELPRGAWPQLTRLVLVHCVPALPPGTALPALRELAVCGGSGVPVRFPGELLEGCHGLTCLLLLKAEVAAARVNAALARLTGLEELQLVAARGVHGTQLLPGWLEGTLPANLTRLTSTDLSHTPLAALPPPLARCSRLALLAANGSRLAALPSGGWLRSLRWLSLDAAHMTAVPPELAAATALVGLRLTHDAALKFTFDYSAMCLLCRLPRLSILILGPAMPSGLLPGWPAWPACALRTHFMSRALSGQARHAYLRIDDRLDVWVPGKPVAEYCGHIAHHCNTLRPPQEIVERAQQVAAALGVPPPFLVDHCALAGGARRSGPRMAVLGSWL